MDDPVIGRYIPALSCIISFEYLIIEAGRLMYFVSKKSSEPKLSFDLRKMKKLLLLKKKPSPWNDQFKPNPRGGFGTEIELYLVDTNGERHTLIPKFTIPLLPIDIGQKIWNRFLSKLCEFSGLFLVETNISEKSV